MQVHQHQHEVSVLLAMQVQVRYSIHRRVKFYGRVVLLWAINARITLQSTMPQYWDYKQRYERVV